MIRFGFVSQLNPPAPFVKVVLRNPSSGAMLSDFPALLDTAADRTVLPDSLVKTLGLVQTETIQAGGFGGATYMLPVYAVLLGLHDMPLRLHFVAAHAEESWVLLGRDVLNSYRVLLDGPNLAL